MAMLDPGTRRDDMAPSCTMGSLLIGCDWACAHGDTETMAHVIAQIAERSEDPLRIELEELSRLWCLDPDLAARRWPLLRRQIYDCEPSRPSSSECERLADEASALSMTRPIAR